MILKETISRGEPCFLIEGPKWGDADFYGNWLRAAAYANVLWEEALKDSFFCKQIDRLTVLYIPDFGIAATWMIAKLDKDYASFVIALNTELECEEFAMMVGMGFFVRTGQRYQMVLPAQLTLEKVKEAALDLANTEDDEFYLHPEWLAATMRYADAKEWQRRLRQLDETVRCADRQLLLETVTIPPITSASANE